MVEAKKKVALVVGHLPSVEEIDQFATVAKNVEFKVISSESICEYLSQNSYFQDLECVALRDHEENPTYLPGLELVLEEFDVVIVKERLGLYAYQAVKAKWKHRFRLIVWIDNLLPYPANDVDQMRTVRMEISNAADDFLVQTQSAQKCLELEGIEKERIFYLRPHVISRVVRTNKTRAEALGELGLSDSTLLISFFGPIEWEEGLCDLVSAIKMVSREASSMGDRLRVLFCGIGSYSRMLRDLFVNMGIDDTAIFVAPNRRTVEAVYQATDAVYFSSIPSRDRVDGDPFRLLSLMGAGIPIIASRSTLVEELCGKHRIDFCQGSPISLVKAIQKLVSGKKLLNSIVQKNSDTLAQRFQKEAAAKEGERLLTGLTERSQSVDHTSLDQQVLEVEARVKNKQYLAAVDVIETIFKLPEIPLHHKANLYRLVGDCFAKLGDYDGAKDAYIQAAELDPYSAKVYIGLGTLGLVRNSHDIAVLHFQKAVSLSPEDEMANLGLGLAFLGMEEPKEAGKWVVKSLEIDPENTAAIYTLVKIAYELSKFDDVERALRRYLAQHPNDFDMVYTLGGVQFKQGRYDEVVDLMEKIIKVDPMDSRAHALSKEARREQKKEANVSSSSA